MTGTDHGRRPGHPGCARAAVGPDGQSMNRKRRALMGGR
ncbi:hypothetical protein SLNWT_6034 [Streptomyces albus]|uniref:Uncharacterized protein n=1 Tax=Streptomyces albus (strain ATCC 21838 / DSM 41398 / FERM P-419 / JCM 4703 / NBRC 107858) TaxID=1081613 RepID=A0A0B5F4A1_STRA4|nr:hypothetical protein SLNWT_6034 [Streptomyces albus]AOU80713.1 hypothetical protein SLNHY_6022 [Streptomyces albus]